MTTRTAAERRADAAAVHRARFAECPSHRLMERISDKWVALVFRALATGPLRHAELARAIPGARQKVLTETLRRLERDGLLSRTVTAGVPARVDYALTPLGETLLPIFDAVSAWADAHMHEVDAAQAEFETATALRPHRRHDTGTDSAMSVGQSA